MWIVILAGGGIFKVIMEKLTIQRNIAACMMQQFEELGLPFNIKEGRRFRMFNQQSGALMNMVQLFIYNTSGYEKEFNLVLRYSILKTEKRYVPRARRTHKLFTDKRYISKMGRRLVAFYNDYKRPWGRQYA